jgi:hypothetical protein
MLSKNTLGGSSIVCLSASIPLVGSDAWFMWASSSSDRKRNTFKGTGNRPWCTTVRWNETRMSSDRNTPAVQEAPSSSHAPATRKDHLPGSLDGRQDGRHPIKTVDREIAFFGTWGQCVAGPVREPCAVAMRGLAAVNIFKISQACRYHDLHCFCCLPAFRQQHFLCVLQTGSLLVRQEERLTKQVKFRYFRRAGNR